MGLAIDGIMLMQMKNIKKTNKKSKTHTLNKYEFTPYTCTYLIFYISFVWTISQVYTTKNSVCATLTWLKHFINTSFLVLQHTLLLKILKNKFYI